MAIRGVLETCLYVDDLSAAEPFYRDILGLHRIAAQQGRHIFFECGQGVLLIFHPDQAMATTGSIPPHGARGPGHVAFAVAETELPAWRERLARHGIAIESEVQWGQGGRSLYFRDPAGNSVEIATPRIWGLPEWEDRQP